MVHPSCTIIAEGGNIIIGEYNIFEERVKIINRARKDEKGQLIKKDMYIGSYNVFEVQAYRFRHAYGLQFHLDARQHDIPSWWDDNVARYAGRRGAQPLDEQIADADRYEAAIDRFARRFLTTALAPVITHDTEEITS